MTPPPPPKVWTMTAFMGRRALGASDRGFSVTEMAVVGAISSIMLLGSLNLAIHSQKRTSDIQSRLSESKLDMLILNSMSDSVCKGTFSGKKIGDPITKIKSAGKVCYDDTGTPSPNPNSCSTRFEAHCDTLQSPLKLCSAAADCGSGSHHCQGHETVFYDMSLKGGSFGNHFKAHHIKTAPLSPVTPGRAELQIFYSRPGANFERKDASLPCSAADLRGCYKKTYTLKLSGTPTPSGAAGAPIGDCSLLTTGGGKHCIEINCSASSYKKKGIGIKRGPDCEHNGAHHDTIYTHPPVVRVFENFRNGQSFGKWNACMLSKYVYHHSDRVKRHFSRCHLHLENSSGNWTGIVQKTDGHRSSPFVQCSAVCFNFNIGGGGKTAGCSSRSADIHRYSWSGSLSKTLGKFDACGLSFVEFQGRCWHRNSKCSLRKSGKSWTGSIGHEGGVWRHGRWTKKSGNPCSSNHCMAACLPESAAGASGARVFNISGSSQNLGKFDVCALSHLESGVGGGDACDHRPQRGACKLSKGGDGSWTGSYSKSSCERIGCRAVCFNLNSS